ncbi:MAG: BMP family ABC transporter substrate-binding protein [Lachnospiraceae bacterium]|nr:BMP family ABC transporter substrate-binding protein [Lachnospiraceae bacterium]
MKAEQGMKRIYLITLLSALAVLVAAFCIHQIFDVKGEDRKIKVGFVYVGDASTAYTCNFLRAQLAIETEYGNQAEVIAKYNVAEGNESIALQELVDAGCTLIFTTSFGYGESAKEYAKMYPNVQFCQATCTNANTEPVLENYHTFMGAIYQGRYISGVVAGMKLKELIDSGMLSAGQAKIGYVGAYPFAEVISGYTAFFLGVRSVIPEAEMTVKYTNTWSSYTLEKACAKELIEEGCVIIAQHSDTVGPAAACEETEKTQIVYHVGYNQSMLNVAPSTYLTGSRIDWKPYILSAVEAVLAEKDIESYLKGNIHGNDAGAGFDEGWVQMLELNELVAAEGTKEKVAELIEEFKDGNLNVFQGEYIGVNPYDKTDILDLREGYIENETCSAPTFSYVLEDVITVEE